MQIIIYFHKIKALQLQGFYHPDKQITIRFMK